MVLGAPCSAQCFCAKGEAESKARVPLLRLVALGVPCSSASPHPVGLRAGDAPGLADHTLPLAAHQNHPGEATDLILCPRLFPHQAPAQALWNLLPVSRKEIERKSPSKRSPGGQLEKPWLNLPCPLLPGGAAGWHHSHPQLQNSNPCPAVALPGPGSPRLLWEEQGFSPPAFPHHGYPSWALPLGAWHLPSSRGTPRLPTRHGHAHGTRSCRGTSRLQPCHPTFPQALCLSSLLAPVEFSSPSILILSAGNL